MASQANGTFETKWDVRAPYDEGHAANLGTATVHKTFSGDLEASSVAEVIKADTGVDGSAGYVAVERIVGSVHGRSGSFVLQHSGIMNRGAATLSVSIVPDTGDGELAGIQGEMVIEVVEGEHTYTLNYTLAE